MKLDVSKPNLKNVYDRFNSMILNKDIPSIKEILTDDGEYEIQTKRLNTITVNKKRFVTWFKKRLNESNILNVTFDQCLFCSIGKTVLLINDGTFPRQIKDSSERAKTGLMLNVEDGQISQIKFCYTFVKTENKCVFELKMDRIKYLEKQGYSMWQAIRIEDNESQANTDLKT